MPDDSAEIDRTGPPRAGRYAIEIAVVFGLYFATARLGLEMDAVSGVATAVWPPTGIALVAIWTLGYRLWPAVAAAALAVNLSAGAPALTAAGMAAGNTLEAVVGVYLLERFVGFRPALDRLRDAVGLVLAAGVASTMISASVGVASGWLGGVIPGPEVRAAWATWWTGDLIADLVLAPVLFTWIATPRLDASRRQALEAAALATSVLVVGFLVFGGAPGGAVTSSPHLFLPAVLWAALRFGPRGAATTTFLVSLVAITGTARGLGPFQAAALGERLLALQVFMAAAAATGLVLAALSAERTRVTEELRESLAGKVGLLQELHHRVKNNLQLVSSLLGLQARAAEDDRIRDLLHGSQERVRAMALVHELLYAGSDVGHMDLGAYARTLTVNLAGYGGQVRVATHVDAGEVRVPVDSAIPCGLILNELVSNSLKHAFGGRETGRLEVTVRAGEGGDVVLSVADDGVGLPQHMGIETTRSMGFDIVRALTKQLHGRYEVAREGGTRVTITFPTDVSAPAGADPRPGAR